VPKDKSPCGPAELGPKAQVLFGAFLIVCDMIQYHNAWKIGWSKKLRALQVIL